MTKPVIEIHPVSMSGIRLYAKCGEIVVSSSTGFLWLNAERYYLITNWHCLTGVNPTSGRYLSNTGARPTSATIEFVTTNSAVKHKVSVDLFDDEGDPLWLVHPTAGEQVDIAALLLPNMDRETVGAELILTSAMNEIAWANVEAVVGDELFVVGHPRNLHQHGLPLWKRATFATEPNLFSDRAGFRQVWIDCATREGMSGSPVVQVKRSMYYRGPMDKSGYEDSPSGYRFYGIYSGRVLDPQQDPRLDDQLVAQIGIVWPRELVERVVASGVRDHFRRDSGFAATVERY